MIWHHERHLPVVGSVLPRTRPIKQTCPSALQRRVHPTMHQADVWNDSLGFFDCSLSGILYEPPAGGVERLVRITLLPHLQNPSYLLTTLCCARLLNSIWALTLGCLPILLSFRAFTPSLLTALPTCHCEL